MFSVMKQVLVESLDKKENKILTKEDVLNSDKVILEDQPNWVSHKYDFNDSPL